MKVKKMSPEEVRCAIALLAERSPPAARNLESHIAWLIAEWDEAQRSASESGRENVVLADRLRIVGDALDESQHGRAALRERVCALEAEATIRRTQYEVAAARSEQVERERDRVRTNVERWHARAQAAEARLAAIRQRAGDTQRLINILEEKIGLGGNAWLHAVVRYVLGEDESAPSAPQTGDMSEHDKVLRSEAVAEGRLAREGNSKPGASPEAGEPCSNCATGPAVDPLHPTGRCACGGDGTCAWCADVARRETLPADRASAEPSTAEAFATVREAVGGWPETFREVTWILSLLERRMGALVRVAEGVLSIERCQPDWLKAEARSALTDTPPVFTLEETSDTVARVADAIRFTAVGRDDYEAQEERARAVLAILRKPAG
jgi:hypothetical protein